MNARILHYNVIWFIITHNYIYILYYNLSLSLCMYIYIYRANDYI